MKKARFGRKVKNFMLKSITAISFLTTLFLACCMDSECWKVPICIMVACILWIFIFSFANGFFE